MLSGFCDVRQTSLIHHNNVYTIQSRALPVRTSPFPTFCVTTDDSPRLRTMLSFRRTFPVNPDSLATGHPYSFDNSKTCQIAFFEFRGTGPPSSDFGYPGDVYVDLTPGVHGLYWRDRHGRSPGQWRRWRNVVLDKVPLHKYLTSHPWASDPQQSDLYLWTDPNGVTWTSRAEICASRVAMVQKNIATIPPGERNPDVDALVAEILARMIEAEDRRTLPPIQDKRDRYSGGTSPQLPGHPRSITEQRERSRSSASQYSLPEAFSRIPSTHRGPSRRSPAPNPVQFRPSSSSPRSDSPHPYTPAHHDRRRSPLTPSPPSSDTRHDYISSAEPPRRQTPAVYSAYGAAGPSNPPPPETRPETPTPNPHPGATEQELRESFAWNEMQRAQYAEAHFKRELRLKNRELSKFKKKEKDVISMSFMYQKKEQELMAGP
ncbi:hypothetical protein DFH07DRAFT_355244 [Mycena maculata]|uniref:Uncharacterized protein n=1 Tax=Mycena maculata TaxID=230809 RepID=A0AAD7MGB8_9AGAR|nr:hypothetical protein DFH07DRAFT_355244 [Mycena maculata]